MRTSIIKCSPINKEITLLVKYFTNNYDVKINDTSLINDLKKIIHKLYNEKNLDNNIEQSDIRLFFGGKELKDDVELFNYNIKPESIILMNLKIK